MFLYGLKKKKEKEKGKEVNKTQSAIVFSPIDSGLA